MELDNYLKQNFDFSKVTAINEPHLACVLLLDTSGSMEGQPLRELNNAINRFIQETNMNELAKKRVDVAIVGFDDEPYLISDFIPVVNMKPVQLSTGGLTSMGSGINMAIDLVKERNRFYSSTGVSCFKPWIFMITDGLPTDSIQEAARRITEEEQKGKLKFFALGVEGYDPDSLFKLTNRVIELSDTNFSTIFDWLSESMCIISTSRIGETIQLGPLPYNAKYLPPESF